jgi:hypothetical protein
MRQMLIGLFAGIAMFNGSVLQAQEFPMPPMTCLAWRGLTFSLT